jgi:exonuclease III
MELLVDNNSSDIVCLTETWLTGNIPDEAINRLGMNLIRLDRKHRTGGAGVAVLINNKI